MAAPSLKASAVTLEDAVCAGAGSAELVALEERQAVRVDLHEVPTTEPTGAPRALAGLRPGDGGRVDVEAVDAPVGVVRALAGRTLGADLDLVDGGGLGEGGDEEDAALEADLVFVVSVEGETSSLAGEWWRGCAILRSGHGASTSVVKALPPERYLRGGPFSYLGVVYTTFILLSILFSLDLRIYLVYS